MHASNPETIFILPGLGIEPRPDW